MKDSVLSIKTTPSVIKKLTTGGYSQRPREKAGVYRYDNFIIPPRRTPIRRSNKVVGREQLLENISIFRQKILALQVDESEWLRIHIEPRNTTMNYKVYQRRLQTQRQIHSHRISSYRKTSPRKFDLAERMARHVRNSIDQSSPHSTRRHFLNSFPFKNTLDDPIDLVSDEEDSVMATYDNPIVIPDDESS